jgi:hypothetical protein
MLFGRCFQISAIYSLLAATLVFGPTGSARAEGVSLPATGADLEAIVSQCAGVAWNGAGNGEATAETEQSADFRSCYGYQAGIIAGSMVHAHLTGAAPLFCLPDETENKQIDAAILDLLNAYPEARGWQSSAVVLGSMMRSFPCQEPVAE